MGETPRLIRQPHLLVSLQRLDYDYLVKWMSDSWPQFSTDRKTDSSVPPWWFTEQVIRRIANRRSAGLWLGRIA